MTNGAEAVAGTNPLDPRSRLWSDVWSSGGSLTVRWPVLPLKRHEMLESTNLNSWSLAGGSPVVVGNEYQQSFAVSGARKFYRARVSDLDADSDENEDVAAEHPDVVDDLKMTLDAWWEPGRSAPGAPRP
jgi:hypothetical protein